MLIGSAENVLFAQQKASEPLALNPVTLSAPKNDSTNVTVSPTLYWQQSQQTSTYIIELHEGDNNLVLRDTIYAVRRRTLTDLKPKTTYYWRVTPVDSTGILVWSDFWHFTTGIGKPNQVRLIFPADKTEGHPFRGLDFFWQEDSIAKNYDLQLALTEDMLTGVQIFTSFTNHLRVPELQPGTHYFWRVRASNGEGPSKWSEVRSFQTESVSLVKERALVGLDVQLFPNPSQGSAQLLLHLSQASTVAFHIMDGLGRRIRTEHLPLLPIGAHTVNLPIVELKSGLYIITVEGAGTAISTRLIVQR